jgi:hypothetical protein
MSLVAPTIVVVLGITKSTPVAKLIETSTTVVNAMTVAKSTFSNPVPALTTVSTGATALANAQSAYKAHLGTRAARDDAWRALVTLMQQLREYVQGVASANPAQAENIAQDAAMTLRKSTPRQKSDLAVKPVASGSVKVVAKALKGARANDFEYSTDGGKTWVAVPTSTRASTTITGLVPGTTVTYRHRPITKTGPGDWSQSVTAVVT